MKRIIVIRHGESEWNLPCPHELRRFTGRAECPLTQKGKFQAFRAGELIRELRCSIDHIFCSNLERARDTARCIGSGYGRALPTEIRPALAERSLGLFEGRYVEQVFGEYPEFRDDFAFCNDFVAKAPGGENLAEVTQRAWPVWEEASSLDGDDALVVSHAVTIRCLLGKALGLDPEAIKKIQVPNAVPMVFSCAPSPALLYPESIPSLIPSSTSIL